MEVLQNQTVTDSTSSSPVESATIILRTVALARSFGRVQAVSGLNLTVRSGEIYGFLGMNGAGKTTTIRMLMGIVKPDAGVIEILGCQTRRTTIQQKRLIGYVSQEQNFYPWMTCQRLGRFVGSSYPSWDHQEFERLLALLQVPPDRKTSQLSGGTRVKLALALALASRPALLILDEPTSGLDPVARREFLDIILRQARDHRRTTFFSSHIIGEVERVADTVGIIHQGKMLYEGSMSELRRSIKALRIPDPAAHTVPPVIPLGNPPAGTPVQPLPLAMPPQVKLLREEYRDGFRELILQADAEYWDSLDLRTAEIKELSVEDIFIALVGVNPAGV